MSLKKPTKNKENMLETAVSCTVCFGSRTKMYWITNTQDDDCSNTLFSFIAVVIYCCNT